MQKTEIPASAASKLVNEWKRRSCIRAGHCTKTDNVLETALQQIMAEHAAACYANCAMELEELLKG